jgi:hypothetical protein
MVKDFNGFSIDSTTHLTPHQTGTAVATTVYSVTTAQHLRRHDHHPDRFHHVPHWRCHHDSPA